MFTIFIFGWQDSQLSITSRFQWIISIRPEKEKKLFADLTLAIISVCPNAVSLRSHSYLLMFSRVLLKTWKHTEDGEETAQSLPFDISSLPCYIYLAITYASGEHNTPVFEQRLKSFYIFTVSMQQHTIFTQPWHSVYATYYATAGTDYKHPFISNV